MNTKIHILNASGKFNDVFDLIDSKCENVLEIISTHFTLPKLDISISPASQEYKTNIGILGCVTTPYLVEIMIDTDRADLLQIIQNEVPATIAHELYHVIRESAGVEEKTLLQILISEGLACHFEATTCNNEYPSFFTNVKEHDWLALLKKIKPHLDNEEFDYATYFGGADEDEIPNHAGYWVGFNLVSRFIEKNGGNAVSLVGVPACDILESRDFLAF